MVDEIQSVPDFIEMTIPNEVQDDPNVNGINFADEMKVQGVRAEFQST